MLELVARILIYGVITLTPRNRIISSGFKIITTGTKIRLSKDTMTMKTMMDDIIYEYPILQYYPMEEIFKYVKCCL